VYLFDFEEDKFTLETKHDFQGCDFVYYDEPVKHYSLKWITKKVGSFQELTYYAEVFLYLNPDCDYNIFLGYFQWLGSRDSGLSIRTYTKGRIEHYIKQIYFTRATPYCRRNRRVIFNPDKIISPEDKISIASQLVRRGKKYSEIDVLIAIDHLRDGLIVITSQSISDYLYCSPSTVNRLISDPMKSKIREFNKMTREEQKIRVLLENIELLTNSGDSIKVRALKEMTSIRDYSLIKKAMQIFQQDSDSSF